MEIQYPIDNLIPEIVSDSNMYSGYDYVISRIRPSRFTSSYPGRKPATAKTDISYRAATRRRELG